MAKRPREEDAEDSDLPEIPLRTRTLGKAYEHMVAENARLNQVIASLSDDLRRTRRERHILSEQIQQLNLQAAHKTALMRSP